MFDAYTVSIDMIRAIRKVLPALTKRDRNLTKQVQKAATSVALNVAEATGRQGGDRLHHFNIAAGSAREVLAGLDVAVAWGYLGEESLTEVRALLDRELAMLYRLTHSKR